MTFISQCEKKANKRTRQVLDAFADRIGSNTWQTIITEEGLQAVLKLLKKTASKNTAVSCHWRRSYNRTDLLWIVGNRNKFNAEGIVPVNRTKKDLLHSEWENDWKYLPAIKALTAIAALLHDWGKASICFQEKLNKNSPNKYKGDPLRHEWISCLIFNAFVNASNEKITDENWLNRFINGEINEESLKKSVAKNISNPLGNLPNIASLIAWLVVSHHRVPSLNPKNKNDKEAIHLLDINGFSLGKIKSSFSYENRYDEVDFNKRISDCLNFSNGLLSESSVWIKEIKKWSRKLMTELPTIKQSIKDGSCRLILSHARLSLMLGDHFYSSQEPDDIRTNSKLFANTGKKGELKQKLDEHLVGVAKNALKINQLLPMFESELEPAYDNANLNRKSPNPFEWQDKAVNKILQWKDSRPQLELEKQYGFFIVNMASTGCGKTFANAKVMQALSYKEQSLRYILALGLRTLTLQTGDEYKTKIGLDDTKLAVLIGSKAVKELHEMKVEEPNQNDNEIGSESKQSIFDDEIIYDSPIPENQLITLFKNKPKAKKLLYAPVLVSTIDHIMPATEAIRGGRYILPYLRLMSSDLVIDEIDDFNGKDLIAIGRLIHLAGMLGRKVMISSATIPPDLAEGYFHVYKEGWKLFAKSRGRSFTVGSAWMDEFGTHVKTIDVGLSASEFYRESHSEFIEKRIKKLLSDENRKGIKRKAKIVSCEEITDNIEIQFFEKIKSEVISLHSDHSTVDVKSGKKVSFGVVRVANIDPCIALTEFLLNSDLPKDVDIRVMAYHSRQVLLLRSEQEKHLDSVLKRKEKDGEIPLPFKNKVIRHHIDNSTAKNIVFILVATPVEEVGRDHDFDWSIIEPSSYRSIVQLAGRILRHRHKSIKTPNIAIMQYNLRALKKESPAYTMPGFETHDLFKLDSHDMDILLEGTDYENRINAIPRIKRKSRLRKEDRFADLEHAVMENALTNYSRKKIDTLEGWVSGAWWFLGLPQKCNTFRESEAIRRYFLKYDDGNLYFVEFDDDGENFKSELNITHQKNSDEHPRLWLKRSFKESLKHLKEMERFKDLSKQKLSLRFGEITIRESERDTMFEYSDQFGLKKLKNK